MKQHARRYLLIPALILAPVLLMAAETPTVEELYKDDDCCWVEIDLDQGPAPAEPQKIGPEYNYDPVWESAESKATL